MSNTKTLYAWATPAYVSESPVDHTWVTTCDNQTNSYPDDAAVVAAGESYWYCWGDFHVKGGTPDNPTGLLGSQTGDVSIASCLVQPNADSSTSPAARGTIYVYGVDGVCHQLANQVLYSTGSPTTAPLTVKKARGYFISTSIYGTYGLQSAAWANKMATCAARLAAFAARGGVMKTPELPDDFEAHARAVLTPGDEELLNRLLALKGEVQSFTARAIPGFLPPDAATLNARNQHLVDQAAILLGPEKFKKVFGVEPGEKVNLVDPTIAAKGVKP
jgi:hypothetical protein